MTSMTLMRERSSKRRCHRWVRGRRSGCILGKNTSNEQHFEKKKKKKKKKYRMAGYGRRRRRCEIEE